jgi:hypothetical protein
VSLSTAQRAAAQAAVAEVRRAFSNARPAVYAAAEGWFASDAAKAVKKQLDDQAARAETWAVGELAMAERGLLDFEKWKGFGEVYARYAASTVKDSYNATLFRVVKDTVKETAEQAGNPLKWPLPPVAKVLLWGAVATVMFVVLVRLSDLNHSVTHAAKAVLP